MLLRSKQEVLHFDSKYLSLILVMLNAVVLVLFLPTTCTRVVFVCMCVVFLWSRQHQQSSCTASGNKIDWSLNVYGLVPKRIWSTWVNYLGWHTLSHQHSELVLKWEREGSMYLVSCQPCDQNSHRCLVAKEDGSNFLTTCNICYASACAQ